MAPWRKNPYQNCIVDSAISRFVLVLRKHFRWTAGLYFAALHCIFNLYAELRFSAGALDLLVCFYDLDVINPTDIYNGGGFYNLKTNAVIATNNLRRGLRLDNRQVTVQSLLI